MEIVNVLSFLGGYFNSEEFELDISKISDITELSEDEIQSELTALQENDIIGLDNTKVTLINIKPKKNKKFNDLYAPVETMEWGKGMKLKLDK
jgi:hypothetical protein